MATNDRQTESVVDGFDMCLLCARVQNMCRSGVKTLSQNIHSTGWYGSAATITSTSTRWGEKNHQLLSKDACQRDDTTLECDNDVRKPNQTENQKLWVGRVEREGAEPRKQTVTAENGKIISKQMTELTSIDVFLQKDWIETQQRKKN